MLVDFDRWWSRRPRVQDGAQRSIAAMELGLPVLIRYRVSMTAWTRAAVATPPLRRRSA
jgi:hypothetical protein